MGFLRAVSAGLLVLGLVACQPTGGAAVSTNSDVAALDVATRQFTKELALSSVMSDRCGAAGITSKQSKPDSIEGFFTAMKSRGYSQTQINGSISRLEAQGSEAAGREAIAYLEDRGVSPGDTEALCNLARREISEGTPVGNLLVVR